MQKLFTTMALLLMLSGTVSASTYTLVSGKWTNPDIWGKHYPGTTIKSGDTVIITGSVVINEPITIEGYLAVETGGNMVGHTDLIIGATGKFINEGNTVVNQIINEGTIVNNRSMDAISNIDNRGKISNGSNMAAGNDFNNSGVVEGKKSTTCMVQNNLVSSPQSKLGAGTRFFYGGSSMENPEVAPTAIASTETTLRLKTE